MTFTYIIEEFIAFSFKQRLDNDDVFAINSGIYLI